jgi:hypothetical protein
MRHPPAEFFIRPVEVFVAKPSPAKLLRSLMDVLTTRVLPVHATYLNKTISVFSSDVRSNL